MFEKRLVCKECGGKEFKFKWQFEDEEDEINKYICHPGWGFEFKDSIVECCICGKSSEYETEDFLEVKEAE